jgi:hypothetical protein
MGIAWLHPGGRNLVLISAPNFARGQRGRWFRAVAADGETIDWTAAAASPVRAAGYFAW